VARADHDDKNYYIQLELLGVKKEEAALEVSDQSFRVRGERGDIEFLGYYILPHGVDAEKVKIKFNNGLLSIEIQIKRSPKRKKIKTK
jgi:HSP20 family molecular chaperone IbpA